MSVIGGRDILDDRRKLKASRAIVATMGRFFHLIDNCVLSTKDIKLLVLDEADKLVAKDSLSNIDRLFKMFRKKPQIIASSATYADGLDSILLRYMKNPAAVSATHEMPILIGIKQYVRVLDTVVSSGHEQAKPVLTVMARKMECTEEILKNMPFKQCILFSNSQMRADSYYTYLSGKGWSVELLIGSHEQQRRTATFQKFCNFESRILIASDVMARGIDVENVNLVINLDVPTDSSTYLHRVGRCGRFGTYGIAITLICDNNDMNKFETMLRCIGAEDFSVPPLPPAKEVNYAQLWDFPNEPVDIPVSSSNEQHEDLPSGNYKANEESKSSSTHSENLELYEIGTLMLEKNTTGGNDQLDFDLFDDYSNAKCDDGSVPIEYTINQVQQNDDENKNDVRSHCHAFLEAIKNPSVNVENEDIETTDSETVDEKQPESHHVSVTKRNTSNVTAEKRWQGIYWQQLNQINMFSYSRRRHNQ